MIKTPTQKPTTPNDKPAIINSQAGYMSEKMTRWYKYLAKVISKGYLNEFNMTIDNNLPIRMFTEVLQILKGDKNKFTNNIERLGYLRTVAFHFTKTKSKPETKKDIRKENHESRKQAKKKRLLNTQKIVTTRFSM